MEALKTLRIATRKSPMAMIQAEALKKQFHEECPELDIELIPIVAKGDKILDRPLVEVGGKGVFIKALEVALLNDEADIALHCIKDMSVNMPKEFCLAAILKRDDSCDAFVSEKYDSLEVLPKGAVIGTASPRRQSQLLHLRPDLSIKLCRGNVNSRLKKLADGEYDALLLAEAGLRRLGFENHIKQVLNKQDFLPAIAQGALGIECLSDRKDIIERVAFLNNPDAERCIEAERQVNRILGGDCHSAIAAHAEIHNNEMKLTAMVGSLDGKTRLNAAQKDSAEKYLEIGSAVAEELVKQGAKALLDND